MVNNVMEIGSKLKGKVDKNRVTAALEHIWLSKVFLKKKKKKKGPVVLSKQHYDRLNTDKIPLFGFIMLHLADLGRTASNTLLGNLPSFPSVPSRSEELQI